LEWQKVIAMKKRTVLTVRAGIALGVAALASLTTAYTSWRKQELARLQTSSTLTQTNIGTIEYTLAGHGPAVLIAHGTPGGYDLGVGLAGLIALPDFTFISVSRPGYLRTPIRSGRTPEEQADLYAALLDTLGIPEVTIIGISGGGPSSIAFALRHPQRCNGLVLISGVARRYIEGGLKQEMPPVKRFFREIYERVTSFEPLLYLALPIAKLPWMLPATDALLHSVMYQELRTIGLANDTEQFASITSYPFEQISAPAFVIHGTADEEVAFSDGEMVARKVPNVRFFIVPGGSHLAFYTHAQQVMPPLRDFLHMAARNAEAKEN
jgi:pimeloyl-ACP methyl ester carboxylesterase